MLEKELLLLIKFLPFEDIEISTIECSVINALSSQYVEINSKSVFLICLKTLYSNRNQEQLHHRY